MIQVPEWQRLATVVRIVTAKSVESDFKVGLENVEGWTGRLLDSCGKFDGDGIAFEVGDVLFGKLRPYLAKVWVADRAGAAVGDFLVLRPIRGASSAFIARALLRPEFIDLMKAAVFGAKMPRISWNVLRDVRIPVWVPDRQQEISNYLDYETAAIDAFIADQEELIALIEERFLASVSARLRSGSPEWRPLKLMAEQVAGGTPDSTDERYWAEGKGTPWVAIADMRSFEEGGDTARALTPAGLTAARLKASSRPTVLFAMYASVGAIALVERPCVWNQAIVGLTPRAGVDPKYLYWAMKALRPTLAQLFRSNTQDNLNAQQVANLAVPYRSITEQRRVSVALSVEAEVRNRTVADARESINLLKERRAALISGAVTGKIDVTARKRVLV